ncbi:MAG: lipid-binding SYLF domain-containing protein [Verrucomicrobiales bacterium]|nr:lipid-binding SYLF domain-containing protein [Verrucomicrobiales bacterium]
MKTASITIQMASALLIGAISFGTLGDQAEAQIIKRNPEKLETRIGDHRLRFEQRQLRQGQAIPAQVLANAKGIVIMHHFRAGFGVSADLGGGVAMVRKADGKWCAPAFVSIGKGAIGPMVGADESVTILCLMTDESLRLLKGGGAGGAGVNLEAVAGPLDAGGDIGTVSARQPVLVYSNARGAFIGASLGGGALVGAKQRNAALYGLTMEQILFGGNAKMTPAGEALAISVDKAAGLWKE